MNAWHQPIKIEIVNNREIQLIFILKLSSFRITYQSQFSDWGGNNSHHINLIILKKITIYQKQPHTVYVVINFFLVILLIRFEWSIT